MYINEAAKKTMQTNKFIARGNIEKIAKRHPTRIRHDADGRYKLFSFEDDCETIRYITNWHPSADDLMADDWIVLPISASNSPEKPQERKRSGKCIFMKR